MSEPQVEALLERTEDAVEDGKFETFKMANHDHRSDDYKDWEA